MYEGIRTIYLIHHSHTDIGYTHDQPIVWDLHRRFIETALDECERTLDREGDDAFRWTVETTYMLMHWLESATESQVQRFVDLAKAGRIEVTAMPLNITPLYDTDQLIEALKPVDYVRDQLGLPVTSAMNSDVNGQNWQLVDVLLDIGIEGLSMATNIHFGGAPLEWPNAFHWQGPSGRTIIAWNGWDYGFAREAGIDSDAEKFREISWPRIDDWLRERNYPLRVLMMQLFDKFGDNGPASPTISDFVREWNCSVETPKLRIALPYEWWSAVKKHATALPTFRGDWTDYWNFGSGSSAREIAINRASRVRLRSADAASIAASSEDHPARKPAPDTRQRAWHALNLMDEHTWGADCSVRQPYDDDTAAQWHHKANYAYTARSLSLMLRRDAVAELARRVERDEKDALLLFNPLPYRRIVAWSLPNTVTDSIRGRADDPTAGRHSTDRSGNLLTFAQITESQNDQNTGQTPRLLSPVEVPAFGYTTVSSAQIDSVSPTIGNESTVETDTFRITFDTESGGVTSCYDKRLDRDLVDASADWKLGGWVHESPYPTQDLHDNPRRVFWAPVERRLGLERGWKPGWRASRQGPSKLVGHRVLHWPDSIEVYQQFELPSGFILVQRTLVPKYADWIECESVWQMGHETNPEATYIAFPLNVTSATARIDLGGQAMRIHEDQLPRACRDYYTVQGWVDFSNEDFGVTIACPDAPMVQIGDFNFGANQMEIGNPRSRLFGWVTNNYWETNFRAHQPGMVSARYRLRPHSGPFNEIEAHRFASEASVPAVAHHLAEPGAQAILPREGQLLNLPGHPVLTQHVWQTEEGVYVRMLNASDARATAMIGSGVLRISACALCDLFGNEREGLTVRDGTVSMGLEPRRMATVRISV